MDKIEHFKSFSIVSDGMSIKLDMSRINGNLDKAQFWLDNQVMTDMLPYMPLDTGTLRNTTQMKSRALAGTGTVIAATAPYGRYQYMGKVMVDSVTGKGPRKIATGPGGYVLRFNKGAKLVATDRPLTYSNPEAAPMWFERAKQSHLNSWVDGTRARFK